jgi:hypothetical protein
MIVCVNNRAGRWRGEGREDTASDASEPGSEEPGSELGWPTGEAWDADRDVRNVYEPELPSVVVT